MGFFNLFERFNAEQLVEHSIDLALTVEKPSPLAPTRRLAKSVRPMSVPTEIIITILEAAYDSHDHASNIPLLKACALVCRSWSILSQRLLFRSVVLRSQPAYRAFMSAIDSGSDKGRTLRAAVSSLRGVLDQNQPRRLRPQSLARAINQCFNLRRVSVSLFGMDEKDASVFDSHSLRLLRSGPQISALELFNWSESVTALDDLLAVYPAISSLSLGGTPPSSSLAPCTSQLVHLRLTFQTPVSVGLVDALLHNSAGSLRKVELTREECSSVHLLNHLVAVHGSTLESLSLPSCGAHEQAVAVLSCENLSELCVESPWAAPMVYRDLPQGIKHLALGVDMSTALQPVVNAVKTLTTLDRVTVQVWEGGERHPLLPALQIACAYRGIALTITKDLKRFRALTRDIPS